MGNSVAIQEERNIAEMHAPEADIQQDVLTGSKIYKFLEEGSGFKLDEPQDFYKLRDECLSKGTLFEDPQFLSKSRSPLAEWKRPADICKMWGLKPKLFVDGCTRFDAQQGYLSDCWLLAAVANLTLYKELLLRVVPDDQGFDEKYAGIFHFRFWQHGRWIDVVVDDRLPTDGEQLLYLHSSNKDEFWTALLEKAYAKLHGSYKALNMGFSSEAMVDLTGGITITYDTPLPYFKLTKKKEKKNLEDTIVVENFLESLRRAHGRGSFMACRLRPPKEPKLRSCVNSGQGNKKLKGLVPCHAYSITKVDSVTTADTKVHLLRLWNGGIKSPSPEWLGAWSDKSPKWKSVSEGEKLRLDVTNQTDGEFWISFDDFRRFFERVEICHLDAALLGAEHVDDGNAQKQWHVSQFDGEWRDGVSAGQQHENIETFMHNPQYMITLTKADGAASNECCLIVSLMLKHKRRQIRNEKIGFDFYTVENTVGAQNPLDLNYFKANGNKKTTVEPKCASMREVSHRFKLQPGTYCIIPFTEPKANGEFFLRAFSENTHTMNHVL